MKKALLSLLMIFSLTFSFAQTKDTTTKYYTVPESMLSENQKRALEAEQQVSTYGKWVGLGKEVGTMVNETLKALTDNAEYFANTKVGVFTLTLVAYKVMGRDLVKLLFGCGFFVIAISLGIWWHKKHCVTRKVRTEGNWWSVIKGTAKYEIVQPSHKELAWGIWVVVVVAFIVSAITVFG